jgi:hypothetical protein
MFGFVRREVSHWSSPDWKVLSHWKLGFAHISPELEDECVHVKEEYASIYIN